MMKGSSASSDVNSGTTPNLAGKRIFIKGGMQSQDVAGTGGGINLNNKASLILKS